MFILTLTLAAGASIVWSTLKVGISPMPSSHKARQAMFQLADETGDGPIYDLGSGWGHLVIRLAKRYPQRKIVGYELSMLPWLCTLVLKKILGLSNLTIHRENFLKADLSQASVIMCYLHAPTMKAINEKLVQESGGTQYLISHNFALPTQPALKVIRVKDFYRSPVYLYRLNNLAIQL
jgi:hypothetical protein